jgi:hypothetical protein
MSYCSVMSAPSPMVVGYGIDRRAPSPSPSPWTFFATAQQQLAELLLWIQLGMVIATAFMCFVMIMKTRYDMEVEKTKQQQVLPAHKVCCG